MASDEAYMDFLDKADQDPSEGYHRGGQGGASVASGDDSGGFKTAEAGVEAPSVLVKATKDAFYSSESDEPFVPVALSWEKGLPTEEEFAKLVGHWDPAQAEVQILDPVDWDTQGQYSDVIEAVREASKGNDVRVYRIGGKSKSRVEYWVVTATGEGRLVGAKALAIES